MIYLIRDIGTYCLLLAPYPNYAKVKRRVRLMKYIFPWEVKGYSTDAFLLYDKWTLLTLIFLSDGPNNGR